MCIYNALNEVATNILHSVGVHQTPSELETCEMAVNSVKELFWVFLQILATIECPIFHTKSDINIFYHRVMWWLTINNAEFEMNTKTKVVHHIQLSNQGKCFHC